MLVNIIAAPARENNKHEDKNADCGGGTNNPKNCLLVL